MSEQLKNHCGDVTAPLDLGGEQHLSPRGEELYREIFEDSPVAIWVEDWSRVKAMIDRLARRGVKNWRRYFERSPDQLVEVNSLCEVIDVNAATLSIYGATSKEEVLQSTYEARMTAGELKLCCDEIVAVAEGASRFVTEATETALDGSEIFTCSHVVIPDEHRKTWSRVIFTIEDITERKRVEKALQVSEQGLANAQRLAHLGHWDWDIVSGDLHMSDEACRIYGFEPQAFAATLDTCLQAIHVDDRDRVTESVDKSISLGKPFSNEFRILRPDGSQRHVREHGEVSFGDDGEPVRMIRYHRTQTCRGRAESKRDTAARLLRELTRGHNHQE